MKSQIGIDASHSPDGMSQTNAISELLSRMANSSHRAGTFGSDVLLALAKVLPPGPISSLETGCGKSTVMFSNISAKHLVFAYDDRDMPDSSVNMVIQSPDFRKETTEFVFGPTQKTLPAHVFQQGQHFDVIVIDGPHGYPFPDLEYAFLYPLLKEGSILIVDDIHIPSVGHMFDLLRADRMYDEVGVFASTGVLRRTGVIGVPPDGDHWYEQHYNISQFPRSMEKYHPDRSLAFGETAAFKASATVAKYQRRGVEYDARARCAATVDVGAVFEFQLPCSGGTAFVDFEYRSVNRAASESASAVVSSASHNLIYQPEFAKARFRVPVGADGRVVMTFLHPNALAEHDIGIKRYDFRRLGVQIKCISFQGDGSLQSQPVRAASQQQPKEDAGKSQEDAGKSQEAARHGPQSKAERSLSAVEDIVRILDEEAKRCPYKSFAPPWDVVTESAFLLPSNSSLIRFLPFKQTWMLSELIAFEGEEFAYVAARSLARRLPTSNEVHWMGSDTRPWARMELLLRLDRQNRKAKTGVRLLGVGGCRRAWNLSVWFEERRLAFAARAAHSVFRRRARGILRDSMPEASLRKLMLTILDRVASIDMQRAAN